jgi:hypothetical protein
VSEAREAALRYHAFGWQPVAAPVKGKRPRGEWKRFQTERATDRDVEDSFARPANVFLITGSISQLAVLDCDDEKSLNWWREKLGDALDKTTAVRTGGGWHFYFSLGPGEVHRNQSNEDDESGKWDIRAEGGGVIAPPSVHESGRVYTWERGPDCLLPAPAEMWESERAAGPDGGNTRSLLTHLLQNPPTEGNRNNWLTKVAGHYAKHIPHRDAFEQMVWDAAAKLPVPLPEDEIEKMIESVWMTEQAKFGRAIPDVQEDGSDAWRRELTKPSEQSGYLVSGGNHISIQVKIGSGEDATHGLAPWMDADVRVLGVITREDDGDRHDLIYSVQLRYLDGFLREDTLSARDASDHRRLTEWLAIRGITFSSPDNASPRRPGDHVRFLRYLKCQDAPPMEAADALGWHKDSESFITHDQVIRASGPSPFENVRPDATMKRWAPYRYGFDGTEDLVRHLLAEVLTFHDETVTAVFGSWWAACFLKPQLMTKSSQFPFMALEAASESGKTTGFFSLMMQLAGNHSGQMNPTRAALRDYLSAHNNGIVWVDDLDDLDSIGEILRQVTVGGSMVKKGQDNHSQVVATMRAALVVSGESLGLKDQKALVDRAVSLTVPSPTSRRSKHGDYAQWDDVKSLTSDHPDLSVYAGTVVQMALGQVDQVSDLKKLRVGSGRYSDTLAILRCGARILRGMLGEQGKGIVQLVDEWVKTQADAYTGTENALTLRLIPTALASTGWLVRPEPPDDTHRKVASPVFVDEDEIVWFSPKLLSEWWVREPKAHKVIERVESSGSLEKQAQAMGLGGQKGVDRKDFKLSGTQKAMRYWRCPKDLSLLLLERSRGIERSEHGEPDDGQLIRA